MQYTITISQYAVITSGLDVDLVDMAIFDFIKHYAHSEKCMKLQTDTGIYFWVSHALIIQQMPILGISTGAGIVKHINRLIDAGLLVRHPGCDSMRKTFYKFGENYDRVNFITPNESSIPLTKINDTPNDCCGITPNKNCGNQDIDNINIQRTNNIPPSGALFDVPEVKKSNKTSENLCLFENSRYSDFDEFRQHFVGPEFDGVDIAYYFHAVADWSAQKGKKMRDWIATARNFIRGDIERGKLHRTGGGLTQDEIAYLQSMGD